MTTPPPEVTATPFPTPLPSAGAATHRRSGYKRMLRDIMERSEQRDAPPPKRVIADKLEERL